MKYIRGDSYINGVVAAISELVAVVLSGVLFEVIGLKKTLICSYLISAVGMFCLIAVDTNDQTLLAIFVLGSKFGVSSLLNIAYCGNSFLFPTSVLATSFGICALLARSACIFGP